MKKTITILALFFGFTIHAQCWQAIDGGVGHTVALKNDNSLWTWGLGDSGQIGNGTLNFSVPEKTEPLPGASWKSSAAGFWHSTGIKTDGTLWLWGNYYTNPETLSQLTLPVQIGLDANWKTVDAGIDFSLLLKDDNTLWSFGYNVLGQLGNGTLANTSQPSQVGTDTWQQISAGLWQASGIKSNGTLWAWGNALGLTLPNDHSIPAQVGTSAWSSVSSGGTVSAAIKNDGTLWAWGLGGFVGDGTNDSSTQPVAIGTAQYLQVSAGCDHVLALRNDGTIWSWGENVNGQLGDGTTENRSSPVQVGTGTNWIKVISGCDHSYAIDSGNKLWAWGGNFAGALGIGVTDNLSVPTLVSCSALASAEFETAKKITLYPNPAHDSVSIRNEDNVPVDAVAVIDFSGKTVMQTSGDVSGINVDMLSTGLYLVKIVCGMETITVKLVKD